ncbi:DUF6703 family protein [Allonocardiopsis opalescens]|uniref:Uncharacterized protein n=1 Tax=Allonocardiopsis opalescens TaxID=1144618 RepID=A0A2T0QFM0_9ACTN|nr:DUF6703 family protein [Allonocardiopsis opalescens]PRY02712.1 hypothetical protein CLV72_1011315 [Allonocardiopsis opalescens]
MSPKRKRRGRAPGRPGQGGPRRPLPEGDSFYTPASSPLRRAIERRSAAPLVYLHQAPRWLLPVALTAVLLVGMLVAGPLGALALVVLAAFIAWLCYLSWPRLTMGKRLVRLGLVALVLVGALLQAGIRF